MRYNAYGSPSARLSPICIPLGLGVNAEALSIWSAVRLNAGDGPLGGPRGPSANNLAPAITLSGTFLFCREKWPSLLSNDGRVPSFAIHIIPQPSERLINGASNVALFGSQISPSYKPIDGFFRGSWTQEWNYVAHECPSNKNGPAYSEEEYDGA